MSTWTTRFSDDPVPDRTCNVDTPWSMVNATHDVCSLFMRIVRLCWPQFIAFPLQGPPGQRYLFPDTSGCGCSVPAFNLCEACQMCQTSGSAQSFDFYTENCSATTLELPFSATLLAEQGIELPPWTLFDSRFLPAWTEEVPLLHGAAYPQAETSPAAIGEATSTTRSQSGGGPGAGVIAGGAVAGITGVALLVYGIAFFVLYRWHARREKAMDNNREGRAVEQGGHGAGSRSMYTQPRSRTTSMVSVVPSTYSGAYSGAPQVTELPAPVYKTYEL